MSKEYSVWVGGSEINSEYLTKEDAFKIAKLWKASGYTDVKVRKEF
jgi:hypothetical protein